MSAERPTLLDPKDLYAYGLDRGGIDERWFGPTTETAAEGVRFENTSPTEPLVILRYYGPEANPDAPAIGDA